MRYRLLEDFLLCASDVRSGAEDPKELAIGGVSGLGDPKFGRALFGEHCRMFGARLVLSAFGCV